MLAIAVWITPIATNRRKEKHKGGIMPATFKIGDNVVLKGHYNPMMTVVGYLKPGTVRCKWFPPGTGELKKDIFPEDALEFWKEDEE